MLHHIRLPVLPVSAVRSPMGAGMSIRDQSGNAELIHGLHDDSSPQADRLNHFLKISSAYRSDRSGRDLYSPRDKAQSPRAGNAIRLVGKIDRKQGVCIGINSLSLAKASAVPSLNAATPDAILRNQRDTELS